MRDYELMVVLTPELDEEGVTTRHQDGQRIHARHLADGGRKQRV